MLIDAAVDLPAGAKLSADVCVIGSGAAGISLARELAASPLSVLLLESGSYNFDEAAADLNLGRSVGRPYFDLTACRSRCYGGTTNLWGGWCLPLDPIDFERGWPFGREELDPFYRRAHEVVQLGPFDYRISSWGVTPDDVPDPFRGPHFVPRMLQNSPPTRFREQYGPELRRAPRVTVVINATVTRIETSPGNTRVAGLSVKAPGGKPFSAHAAAYVLATGGIENARLLLASGDDLSPGLGNDRDLVGRFFTVHVNTPAGTILLADPYTDLSFYTNVSSNGRDYAPFQHRFTSFVGLSEAALRQEALQNMRLMWDIVYGEGIETIQAVRGAVGLQPTQHRLADVGTVMSDLGGAGKYVFRRLFTRTDKPVRLLSLKIHLEPTPLRESRIRLGSQRDALGQRRVELDWQLDPRDHESAQRALRLLGAEVGRTGFGRLHSLFEGDEWPEGMYGDEHHMGTTKMHTDPAQGVVDPQCRVHGTENLWIVGSSVFPRVGFANPTLTIIALALRLGRLLRTSLA